VRRKIFVVDDETVIADSLAAILKMRGYDAAAFYDGLAALSACESSAPDCIVTDVMMPKMDGVELAMKVRERFPACRILLFSGQAATLDLLQAAGASGECFEVLAKPVHPSELLARLEGPDQGRPELEGLSEAQAV
jgi:CheY-like chemotaxis protein